MNKALSAPSQQLQTRASQMLHDLSLSGALRIDRPEAWNAQAYLEALAIPREIAITVGVGYLEAGVAGRWGEAELKHWEDCLVFPLLPLDPSSPPGFAGRLLTGWQLCATEDAHRALLAQQNKPCWVRTSPAGWFWTRSQIAIAPLIIVEEPLDRLALLASGFEPHEVLALASPPGTMLQAQHVPSCVRSLLIAFNRYTRGQAAAKLLGQQLRFHQIPVECCFSSLEYEGKDWCTRWRQYGADGLEALHAHHALLAHNL